MGDITSFQGNLQLNVKRVRKVQEGEYDPKDYLPVSKKDIDEMYTELLAGSAGTGHGRLRCLLLRRMAPRPGRGSGGAGEGAVGHDTHGSSGASAAGPAGSDGIERRRETESLPEGRRR